MGGCDQYSDDEEARSGWTSDEQEIAKLVEEFISADEIPPEIAAEVEKLHDSGHPHQALELLLRSLD
ncbi:hypothetical protein [Haloarcula sp. Atlit-7R]|uniref:hypothetical protein n=1 Tax=Haloarcula sp. Atlit-7R TaxID=2282125 RepID=UPI000EF169C6|nr:hypothetical protein [Haloarcula sp. Atlit-7R]RLM87888.1 hypothetical protein D3D01_22325 [Haloarcula sp. Atlit-7R]